MDFVANSVNVTRAFYRYQITRTDLFEEAVRHAGNARIPAAAAPVHTLLLAYAVETTVVSFRRREAALS